MIVIPSTLILSMVYLCSTLDESNTMKNTDTKMIMSKLKETKLSATNLHHMKLLLSKTTKLRRDWIINKENTARCSTILEQFSYLKNSELVRKKEIKCTLLVS